MGVGVRRTYRVEAIVFQPRLYRPREAAVCLPPVGVAHHIYLPRAVEAEARGLATPLEVVVERKAEERKKRKEREDVSAKGGRVVEGLCARCEENVSIRGSATYCLCCL